MTPADPLVAVAARISRRVEQRHGLAPGALLAAAWLGARRGAAAWERHGRPGPRRAYLVRAALGAVLDDLRADLRRGTPPPRQLLDDPPGRERAPADAVPVRLDARAELERLARRHPRAALVVALHDAAGLTLREAAARLGVTESRASQLRALAVAKLPCQACGRRRATREQPWCSRTCAAAVRLVRAGLARRDSGGWAAA